MNSDQTLFDSRYLELALLQDQVLCVGAGDTQPVGKKAHIIKTSREKWEFKPAQVRTIKSCEELLSSNPRLKTRPEVSLFLRVS